MSGIVHVVGAGLSGLSAAVELAGEGRKVAVYEAAKFAGGRCRTYYDSVIDLEIDNGNHLLLSGNRSALAYLRKIGGLGAMTEAADAVFPFADLKTGERWTLRPNEGRLPWWILDSRRRVPGTRLPDYLAPIGVLRARRDATVGTAMACRGPLYDRLWRPVLLAALNTEPAEADAGLAAQVLRETLAAGGQACRPMVATGGLSAAFIDPALAYLQAHGGTASFSRSLREIAFEDKRATALVFAEDRVAVGPDDQIVLAVPPVAARAFVPGLVVPEILPRHRERAFPRRPAARSAAHPWYRERPDRMAFFLPRPALHHDQLRRPADGNTAPGAGRGDLGRGCDADGACPRASPLADRPRAPGDVRGNPCGDGSAPRGTHRFFQSCACR